MPAELPTAFKVRVAAGVLEALNTVSEKSNAVRNNWFKAVVTY